MWESAPPLNSAYSQPHATSPTEATSQVPKPERWVNHRTWHKQWIILLSFWPHGLLNKWPAWWFKKIPPKKGIFLLTVSVLLLNLSSYFSSKQPDTVVSRNRLSLNDGRVKMQLICAQTRCFFPNNCHHRFEKHLTEGLRKRWVTVCLEVGEIKWIKVWKSYPKSSQFSLTLLRLWANTIARV